MSDSHRHREDIPAPPTIAKSTIALIGFLIVAGYFLLMEHKAHIVEFLPYLLLLACPLMHFFMHKGHSSHHHEDTMDNKSKGES